MHPLRDVWPRWSPDGLQLAFFSRRDTDGKDDEIYIKRFDGSEIRRVTTRAGHDFCPDWSPSGKLLAVASIDTDTGRSINVLNLDGVLQLSIGKGFERVTEPAWSPDGKMIAYTARGKNDRYDIYVEDVSWW